MDSNSQSSTTNCSIPKAYQYTWIAVSSANHQLTCDLRCFWPVFGFAVARRSGVAAAIGYWTTDCKVRIIERPFGSRIPIDVPSISADAKYLIVTGNIEQHVTILQFWIAGRMEPDASCELPCNLFGRLRSIRFDPYSSSSRFAITLVRNVLFGTWWEKTNRFSLLHRK